MHGAANGGTTVTPAAPLLPPGIFYPVTPQVSWRGWMGPNPAGLGEGEGETP